MNDMRNNYEKSFGNELYFKAYINPFPCTKCTHQNKSEYLHCVSIKHITVILNANLRHYVYSLCFVRYLADIWLIDFIYILFVVNTFLTVNYDHCALIYKTN